MEIWEKGIQYRRSRSYGFTEEDEYRFHTLGVAGAAEKIAAHIGAMNGEKAYIFGLLHDYGKRINERKENKFHGREGYEQMLILGYPDIAQICLTHTFPDKHFKDDQYDYPKEWIDWARKKLAETVYTDYDFLIAFCDKLFEACEMVSIEKRIRGIVERYGLSEMQRELLYEESMNLKQYFDAKIGEDTYRILGIKD